MKTYSAYRGEADQPRKKNGDDKDQPQKNGDDDGYVVPKKKRRT
jgi:hypothetical protein